MEVKKYADDAEAILFAATKGKKGEGMIRDFLKVWMRDFLKIGMFLF